MKGPFSYEALAPEDIKFVPLNQTKEMNGKELMEFYEVRYLVHLLITVLTTSRKINISAASYTSFGTRQYIQ